MTAIILLSEVNWKDFQGDSGCEHALKFRDELMTSARPVLRGCVGSGGKPCTCGPSRLTLPGSLVPAPEPSGNGQVFHGGPFPTGPFELASEATSLSPA